MSHQGLSSAEAEMRRRRYGPNLIQGSGGRPPWRVWIAQFESGLVLVLFLACVLSLLMGDWMEASAIAAILVLNAGVGFLQEYRAENAVQALRDMTAPQARVWREGRLAEIPASELVPGDLVSLEAGDIIPGDGRWIEASRLLVNEAVLTGESEPLPKGLAAEGPRGRAFMGTTVVAGSGALEIQETGMRTSFGHIAHLMNTTENAPTPLQQQLERVGRHLLFLCLAVMGLIMIFGLWQGRPWAELLLFSLSLAVAVVPEGLPALVTVALAFGVQRMAARRALVRRLPSVETLGSVSVICTDKTGTLTTGQMRVRELWGEDHEKVLAAAAACCDAELDLNESSGLGDPTEVALLLAARERGIERATLEKANPRRWTRPFDTELRRMSVARADGKIYVKGALESLWPLCGANLTGGDAFLAEHEMAVRGLRVLAIATGEGEEEKNLRLLGLAGIADPPRTEVIQAIAEAKRAGITPVMITGDHLHTATAVARELGLIAENESADGRVHARATPEDKLRIVREWKKRGAIVAMTGDGVNDAPALREAHVGIAMGKTGTQVTRQSADLVLADDNFATIIEAVREGRGVYRNIRKAVVYLLTGNFAELVSVLGALWIGLPVPFLAAQLLWINLVTDSLPGLALIADPPPADLMRRQPRPSAEALLGKPQWLHIVGLGMVEALAVGTVFYISLGEGDLARARSLAFTTLVSSQMFRALSARSHRETYWQVGVLNNLWLVGIVLLTLALQFSLHFLPLSQVIFGLHPLTWTEAARIFLFALIPVSLIEVWKLLRQAEPD